MASGNDARFDINYTPKEYSPSRGGGAARPGPVPLQLLSLAELTAHLYSSSPRSDALNAAEKVLSRHRWASDYYRAKAAELVIQLRDDVAQPYEYGAILGSLLHLADVDAAQR